MFAKLPVVHKFRGSLSAGVYFPGQTLPVEVRFVDDISLRFEAGRKQDLRITIAELDFTVVPVRLPLRTTIDPEGRCIEFRDARITTEMIDSSATSGSLNVSSGEMSLDWALRLTPEHLSLLSDFGVKEVSLAFQDRGAFDATTGSWEIHHRRTSGFRGAARRDLFARRRHRNCRHAPEYRLVDCGGPRAGRQLPRCDEQGGLDLPGGPGAVVLARE